MTRKIGIAIDFSETSKYALRWALENVARSHDHIVVITVARPSKDSKAWDASGPPLIPLCDMGDANLLKNYAVSPDADVVTLLELEARQKDLVVVQKVLYGDPREKICDAVSIIPLDYLVIGSRGLGTVKRVLMGSVSAYVVNNVTCPVTVVKLPPGSTEN